MTTLTGKTVVIPGASRPIGRAIARQFATCGANLVLPWYDWPEAVEEMVEEFAHLPDQRTLSMQCDLRRTDQVYRLVEAVTSRYGMIHYLVNNIERGGMPVVHGSYDHPHNSEQWNLEFDTTVKAKWNLYQRFLPLLQHSAAGSVLNISSIAAHTGRSGPAAVFFNDGYSAANRAIQTFTENWARESGPKIRVNELMLGLIDSRHGKDTRGWSTLTDDDKKALQDHTLLARFGTPEEVARFAFFICVEATFATGAVFRMDGGYILGGSNVPSMPHGVL